MRVTNNGLLHAIYTMDLELQCPHCSEYIIVNQRDLNCHIFRHAVYKNSMLPIDPHAPETTCHALIQSEQVFGCAKPFKVMKSMEGVYSAVICDYI
jgi:hypothetical protein